MALYIKNEQVIFFFKKKRYVGNNRIIEKVTLITIIDVNVWKIWISTH